MKKFAILIFCTMIFYSCIDNVESNYRYEFLTIDEIETPDSFSFGETNIITITYTLPNGCYSFNDLYYEYRDTERIVAVTALFTDEEGCKEGEIKEEYKIEVRATQKEDYIFKFWKGKDSENNDIFEEVIIPVN